MLAERLAEPAAVLPPPLPHAEHMAHLEGEVQALIVRASALAWLFSAGECERLLRRARLNPDACSLDDAWEAYDAGLTPAHYVYAVDGALAVPSFPAGPGEGCSHPPPPRHPSPLFRP